MQKTVLRAAMAALALFGTAAHAQVNWSVLPTARTGAPNEELTFFATISNASDVTLTCQPRFGGFFTRPGGVQGQARFFTFDNDTVGDTANGFVDIPAGGQQNYLVVLTVDRAYRGNVLQYIRCTDPENTIIDLRRIPQVNDFQVVIESGDPPDIVMIGDTISNDGVARVGSTGPRAALMTMAAVNIGGPAENFILVPEISNFSTLQDGYRPTICETDASGVCTGSEDTFVRIANWPTDEVRLFAVRVRVPPQNGIPNYPDQLRLRVRAAPEPDTTGLDRPADFAGDFNQLLDAMFGGYSTGVEAKAQAPFDDLPAPVQQCVTQVDGDTGGDFARSGGMVIVDLPEGAGGPVEVSGFLEFADGQFADNDLRNYGRMQFDFPSESGEGTGVVSGEGANSIQETDRSFPVILVEPDGTRGIRIRWEAQGGGLVDIAQAGSTRCAGAPAPRVATDPATSQAFQSAVSAFGNGTSQSYNLGSSSPFTAPVTVDDFGDYTTSTDTIDEIFVAYGAVAFPQDTPGLTAEQNAANRAGSATAFTGIVAPRGQAGPVAIFVPETAVATDSGVSFGCGIFAFPGTVDTNNGPNGDTDAGVVLLTEDDPAELEDGDCVF